MNLLHYGLQRSGTNFLLKLVKKNYCVHCLNDDRDRSSPLQKHFRLYDEKDIIPEPQYRNDLRVETFADFERFLGIVPDCYLIISKDPYSWWLSYVAWAKKCKWPVVSHHYIEEYNLFYGRWLEFSQQTDRILFVRYIDLLRDTVGELTRLETRLGLKRRFFRRSLSRGANKVAQSGRFSDDRVAYYVNEGYLERYSPEDLCEINSRIDTQVVDFLGYKKEGHA